MATQEELQRDGFGTIVQRLNEGGGGGAGDATSLQTVPISATPPLAGQVLISNGTQWNPGWVPDSSLIGSYRVVANAAGLAAILPDQLRTGMLVYQVDSQHFWQLDDAQSWGRFFFGHQLVDYGQRLPGTTDLYFKGFEVNADTIDDVTLVKFPMEVTTAERVAITHLHPGLTVFDSDLQRLVTFIENSWRVV